MDSTTIKKVAILGASGLTGGTLLNLLLKENYIQEVHILVRSSLGVQHPKLKEHICSLDDEGQMKSIFRGIDAVTVCVGTTLKRVNGDLEAYHKIDVDIPNNAAKAAAQAGCQQFYMISSVGANIHSRNYYLKFKGEAEQFVTSQKLPQICIIRPSFLLGQRKEKRVGERLGIFITKPFSFLIPKKFKPINVKDIAEYINYQMKHPKEGVSIAYYAEMMRKKI